MDSFENKSIDVIISRYNENLEWFEELNKEYFNIIVYNKGVNDNFIKLPNMTIINLDNVGREGHTYLYHIINNYNSLADITIFLPGSGNMEHKLYKINKLLSLIKHHNNAVFMTEYRNNVAEKLYNFKLDNWQVNDIQNKSLNSETKLELSEIRPFGKWYEYYFNGIQIKNISHSGIFSVNNKDILQHSKEYYEKLIKPLCNSSNPEVGHYFERSWWAVFHPMNNTIDSDFKNQNDLENQNYVENHKRALLNSVKQTIINKRILLNKIISYNNKNKKIQLQIQM